MNNKTCYAVLIANILKKDVKDFVQVFKERLIRQLDYDIKINEAQEIRFRNELGGLVISKTNNDRRIMGIINHYIENLKYPNYQGGIENWDEVRVSHILNDFPVRADINDGKGRHGKYSSPTTLMRTLINN
ncbi:hypothetical protein DQQ10_10780 [Pseudochryseolinea flava]|uniref:DUF6933 domain-containing protein n=1 Tax=Pseudochryseolinea flava TaxID=2059302 RepID=A0A364Y3T1_9BACT|nr:hypothetical protein DQQ10_10780 [Pseudochryseolinea flava]